MPSLPSAQRHLLAALLFAALPFAIAPSALQAQAPVHAAGTVQGVSGSVITLNTDAGQQYTVQVADSTRLLQIPPGSKDLSAAQPFALTDIAVGDRILVNGSTAADPIVIAALRVILMKATAIASLHSAEQSDWRQRGSGGLVRSVDGAAQTITITSNGKTITIQLQRTTILRRYAPDSVDFASAMPSTLAQILPGDQLRVRGDRSADGLTITADEIVSGSFRNIAGPITAIDLTAGTITVKDLTTKRGILIHTTPATSLKKLDARASAFFAMRAGNPTGAAAPGGAGGSAGTGAGMPVRPRFDLAQAIQRMPSVPLSSYNVNDAVMVVASSPDAAAASITAITVLGGVEQILSATPKGGEVMTLAPWSLGGDAPDTGGGN
ncbi:MAG TPA: DUF5666 domain-containing protein [Acidobacteriaceae bacterium]|nr:DUF5666 domain-containing protein [Acidobacteriaceae bacterium]